MNAIRRRGAVLIVALVTLLAVMLIASTVVRSLLVSHRQARLQQDELQAQWLAEAAISRAKAQLAASPQYTGETWIVVTDAQSAAQKAGKVDIRVRRVDAQSDRVVITADAHFPDHPTRRATARRQYTLTMTPAASTTNVRPSENDP